MNEKYGIELEAIVNKFKATMQSTAKFVKDLGKEMKDDVTFSPDFSISPDLTRKQLEKFKEDLEREISILKDQIESEKDITPSQRKGAEGFYTNPQKLKEYEYALDLINQRLEELNKESNKTDSNLGDVFKKGISSIKRFTYYLLGARSVFTLFRKYQSIYHQYNEQMMYQTELSQNAIALSLAPAFELLGNVISYVSIGFARFIELLTGINVLSKVTTKGIRDYNKSLKETQTLVAGVDEITNLTTPQTTGLMGQYQALEDFRKKVEEVKKAFDENEFLKAVVDVVEYIKKNWDWIKWLALGTFITTGVISLGFKVAGLANALGTAGTLAGVGTIGTGLAGLATTLGWLTGIGVITTEITFLVSYLIKGKKDLDKADEDLKKQEEERHQQQVDNFIDAGNKLKELTRNNKKGTEEYNTTLETMNTMWSNITTEIKDGAEYTQGQINKINEMAMILGDITSIDYTITLNIEPTIKESSWEKFKKTFFGLLGGGDRGFGHIFGGIPHAKGLDYVPYDNYPAILHKGEAVVPAKYNPTIHSAGNDYTNSLLETLVTKMDDLASRPNVFEIDGQKFASATYGLYTSEEKRQNYNTNVVVR